LPPGEEVALWWLGQSGFAIKFGRYTILIDVYLSDYLSRKYRGTETPHERLMPPPVEVGELRSVDLILCSHGHSDHMDPESCPILMANNPEARLVYPAAERDRLMELELPRERCLGVDAGDVLCPAPGVRIDIIPSAHEVLKTNERAQHYFLGFIMTLGDCTIYHSGDCVLYDGLAEKLAAHRVEIALLPINGRGKGVPGNMDARESVSLCEAANIKTLIPHHYGMFAFNTAEPEELNGIVAGKDIMCIIPQVGEKIVVRRSDTKGGE